MRTYDNGIYRDMTAEEEAQCTNLPPTPTIDDSIDDTEALSIIMGVES